MGMHKHKNQADDSTVVGTRWCMVWELGSPAAAQQSPAAPLSRKCCQEIHDHTRKQSSWPPGEAFLTKSAAAAAAAAASHWLVMTLTIEYCYVWTRLWKGCVVSRPTAENLLEWILLQLCASPPGR